MPEQGQAAAEIYVATHLREVVGGAVAGSPAFRGGQRAADAALAGLDVTGYASHRNEVAPRIRRGASMLSPYIRHGLLSLSEVWDAVDGGPSRDVRKFRDELLWQEFARHWYAVHGLRTRRGIRRELASQPARSDGEGWDRTMACVDVTWKELERDGWLVNQTRMWLASEWAVRRHHAWREGEDLFFRHLLDGSRAANRLGWQWTTGVGSAKHYGFSRWQVNKRAPGLCDGCGHSDACPIEDWPDAPEFIDLGVEAESARRGALDALDPTEVAGPATVRRLGNAEQVWLTAESLGEQDPALRDNPSLPAVFVFDEPLLRRLRLSAKRLVFLVETLSELAGERAMDVWLGDPVQVLADCELAVTFAPVPGFRDRAAKIGPVEVHPWRWLHRPDLTNVDDERFVRSFSGWRKKLRV